MDGWGSLISDYEITSEMGEITLFIILCALWDTISKSQEIKKCGTIIKSKPVIKVIMLIADSKTIVINLIWVAVPINCVISVMLFVSNNREANKSMLPMNLEYLRVKK